MKKDCYKCIFLSFSFLHFFQDVSGTHPSFALNRDAFEVLFKNVKREDEGLYEVKVKDKAGRVKKTFNYVMIVMGEYVSLL